MPSIKVVVNFADGDAYDVRIGPGTFSSLGAHVRSDAPGTSSVLIVSDANVAPLYLDAVRERMLAAQLPCREVVLPAGEATKNVRVVAELWQTMAQLGLDRTCCIIALGGGMVLDVAGFVAATFSGGVNLVHVPTTLRAMVSLAIDGRSSIDLPVGKDIASVTARPRFVCVDTNALSSLPEGEWGNGWAEAVRAAVLSSDESFFWMCERARGLASHDEELLREMIARCLVFRAGVVAGDATDDEVRSCLRYGSELGCAIERIAGYGAFGHGRCIAEGMRLSARLGAAVCGASPAFVEEQDGLLDALGVERIPLAADPDGLIDAMRVDEPSGDGVRFVLPHDVGSWSIETVGREILRAQMEDWLADR
ncbi:3-dehydroquinate synthase family protein [Curtanaerobium respiraculi]|uniref:3-dehydroquinate synthase family protein n=1 Tax=Curtanaerobium respiraculi TaxID=2949669 RepID=UPI0024B38947|nr:3-dehydroquinate synthase family protein [Curtanaerobium respiraculi]